MNIPLLSPRHAVSVILDGDFLPPLTYAVLCGFSGVFACSSAHKFGPAGQSSALNRGVLQLGNSTVCDPLKTRCVWANYWPLQGSQRGPGVATSQCLIPSYLVLEECRYNR